MQRYKLLEVAIVVNQICALTNVKKLPATDELRILILSPINSLKMTEGFVREFISQSVYRIKENTSKIIRCMNELEEAEIWQRPNSASNSIGNLILHLCGNITQYIISSLGEIVDTREREKEFSAKGGYSKSELTDKLNSTTEKAIVIIQKITTAGLLKRRYVQGFQSSGIGNIVHVTEHYSHHTGQIVFWTKLLKNKDLGFYAGINLNKKNEQ